MAKELTHRSHELQELGWSTDDVARYVELWDYRQRWGAINLEREDRQFLRKAEAALPAIVSGKVSVKKVTQEKSYYRRLQFFLDAMNEAEANFGLDDHSRGLWPILLEEELRLIDYYEPVLGLPDSLKAKRFEVFREEIIDKTVTDENKGITSFNFDFNLPLEKLKEREDTKWRPLRDEELSTRSDYPVLPPNAAVLFRKEVRKKFIPLILQTLPSLSDIEKPEPPDEWNRE